MAAKDPPLETLHDGLAPWLAGPPVLRQDGASLSCTDMWGVRGELCTELIKMTLFRFLYRVLEENWGWLRQPAISIYSLFTVILLQLYKFSCSLFFLEERTLLCCYSRKAERPNV